MEKLCCINTSPFFPMTSTESTWFVMFVVVAVFKLPTNNAIGMWIGDDDLLRPLIGTYVQANFLNSISNSIRADGFARQFRRKNFGVILT